MSSATRGSRLTVLVSGRLAAVPDQGGAAWAVLQYVLGLRRLGHDVYFVEPLSAASLKPAGTSLEASANAAYFRDVIAAFGLVDRASLVLAGTRQTVGLPYDALMAAGRRSDLLLNLSGVLHEDGLFDTPPVRAYLDLDPGFTQIWYSQGTDVGLADHTHYVTIGQAIGSPECPVPTCGIDWLKTQQPIVLDEWPVASTITHDAFTTVASWRSYGPVEHAGVAYGQKAHSWRPLFALPQRTGANFRVALSIHPDETADLQALAANGWQILDPAAVTGTPDAYRSFIQGSRAELAVAKSGYTAGRVGWFSDRSICYLASGRPVVAQDTGFTNDLPIGEGLLAFTTLDEATAAVEAVLGDYERHRTTARALAASVFDSDKVLPHLLDLLV